MHESVRKHIISVITITGRVLSIWAHTHEVSTLGQIWKLAHIYRLATWMRRELVEITRARLARSTRAILQSASAASHHQYAKICLSKSQHWKKLWVAQNIFAAGLLLIFGSNFASPKPNVIVKTSTLGQLSSKLAYKQNRELFLYDKQILISASSWISSGHTANQNHFCCRNLLVSLEAAGLS